SKYGPLSDYFTTEIDVEGTQQLISAAKAREVQRRFQREADALYLEAKRSTVSTQSRIPYWMFLLTVILGWNEAMTIIFNPIYLVFFVFVLSASFIVHQLGLWGPVYRLSGTFGNMVAEKAHVLLLEAVNKTEPMAINARRDAAPLESLRSSDASQGTPARQFGRKRHGLTRHGSAQKTSAHPFSSSQNGEDNEMIPLDDLSHRRGHLSDE
ncbi:Dynamin-like GTPase that mediates homotypic ER fusion, partial [Spiromyces aspiralis]